MVDWNGESWKIVGMPAAADENIMGSQKKKSVCGAILRTFFGSEICSKGGNKITNHPQARRGKGKRNNNNNNNNTAMKNWGVTGFGIAMPAISTNIWHATVRDK